MPFDFISAGFVIEIFNVFEILCYVDKGITAPERIPIPQIGLVPRARHNKRIAENAGCVFQHTKGVFLYIIFGNNFIIGHYSTRFCYFSLVSFF